MLGTDGVVRPGPDRSLWQRFLYTRESDPGTPAAELARALKSLGATGAPVLVVDRSSGRSYGDGHQQTLRVAG